MENLFEKIESKLNIKLLVKRMFIFFVIVQPILDIYMSFFDKRIQIVGVSLATIFRFGWVFFMLILCMIYARKKKSTKFIVVYGVLVAIYTIIHHINAMRFFYRFSCITI